MAQPTQIRVCQKSSNTETLIDTFINFSNPKIKSIENQLYHLGKANEEMKVQIELHNNRITKLKTEYKYTIDPIKKQMLFGEIKKLEKQKMPTVDTDKLIRLEEQWRELRLRDNISFKESRMKRNLELEKLKTKEISLRFSGEITYIILSS